MKIEYKCLIYTMINNFIISVIKIICGILFNLSSLLADGMHTFIDFVTDIISLLSIKIVNKRPTKTHPFGFGKIEYISNLFIGIIIFLLGIFIIIKSFFVKVNIPSINIIYFLALACVLKFVSIMIMNRIGKKVNSQVLITSVEESKTDLYSSIGVIVIIILLQFSNQISIFKYSDLIGSIIIGIMVIKISIKIILNNSLSLIGEVEYNNEKIKELEEFIKSYKGVEDQKAILIKYGTYYKLELELDINSNYTLRQVNNLEKKIIKDIKKKKDFLIRYVTIYVTTKIERY